MEKIIDAIHTDITNARREGETRDVVAQLWEIAMYADRGDRDRVQQHAQKVSHAVYTRAALEHY